MILSDSLGSLAPTPKSQEPEQGERHTLKLVCAAAAIISLIHHDEHHHAITTSIPDDAHRPAQYLHRPQHQHAPSSSVPLFDAATSLLRGHMFFSKAGRVALYAAASC